MEPDEWGPAEASTCLGRAGPAGAAVNDGAAEVDGVLAQLAVDQRPLLGSSVAQQRLLMSCSIEKATAAGS
jgi:hypothetical protein